MSDPSDDAGSDSERPFERDRFDAERVADDPIDAFLEDDPVGEAAEPALPTPGTDVDIHPGLSQMFWKLVLLYKLSVVGTSLGALLVVFEQGPDLGPELLVGGLVLLGYSLYLTRRGKARIDAGEFHDDPGEEPTDGSVDGTGPPGVGSTDGGVETGAPAADDSPEGKQ